MSSLQDALARAVSPLLQANEASVAAGRRYGRVFGAATTARLHPHSLDGMRSDLELGASRAKVLLDQVEREKEKLTVSARDKTGDYRDRCSLQRVFAPPSEPWMIDPGSPHTSQISIEAPSARLIQTR